MSESERIRSVDRTGETFGRLSLAAMCIGSLLGATVPGMVNGGSVVDVLPRPFVLLVGVLLVPSVTLTCLSAMFLLWMTAFLAGRSDRCLGWVVIALILCAWSYAAHWLSIRAFGG